MSFITLYDARYIVPRYKKHKHVSLTDLHKALDCGK